MDDLISALYVGTDRLQSDLGCSEYKAIGIINRLNAQLKSKYPNAVILTGKVNKDWYEKKYLGK